MNYVYFQNSAKGSDRIGVVAIGDKNWHLWRSNGAISDPLAPMAIHLLAPMAKAIAIGDNKMAPMAPLSVDTGSEITICDYQPSIGTNGSISFIGSTATNGDPLATLDPLVPMVHHCQQWRSIVAIGANGSLSLMVPMDRHCICRHCINWSQ